MQDAEIYRIIVNNYNKLFTGNYAFGDKPYSF